MRKIRRVCVELGMTILMKFFVLFFDYWNDLIQKNDTSAKIKHPITLIPYPVQNNLKQGVCDVIINGRRTCHSSCRNQVSAGNSKDSGSLNVVF